MPNNKHDDLKAALEAALADIKTGPGRLPPILVRDKWLFRWLDLGNGTAAVASSPTGMDDIRHYFVVSPPGDMEMMVSAVTGMVSGWRALPVVSSFTNAAERAAFMAGGNLVPYDVSRWMRAEVLWRCRHTDCPTAWHAGLVMMMFRRVDDPMIVTTVTGLADNGLTLMVNPRLEDLRLLKDAISV